MNPYYFLPWWPSDYVWQEWRNTNANTKHTKLYLWDFLPNLLDGILISRYPVSPKKARNIRKELHFDGIIFGDSGAHSYRNLDDPPFTCQDILEFYAHGQFNYGLTLDMVASPWVRSGGLSNQELERRLRITVENAEHCLDLHHRYNYPFELVGVVQGWDVESYRQCVQQLLGMGFTYVAIAGQRKLSLLKEAILAVLQEIRQKNLSVKIHVLGTGSATMLPFYVKHGVSSFDSATWFRQAWLSGTKNYFVTEGKQHTAYQATRISSEDFDLHQLDFATQVTCSCPICNSLGQEVLIYKGRQRNFRRAFHNVYQYIQLLNAYRNL